MSPRVLTLIASASLFALIVLGIAWEAVIAPIRPGGSWMMLKVVPLLVPLFGILRGKRYTYQWSSMLILLYVTEGSVRAMDPHPVGLLAMIEAGLSVIFFVAVVIYSKITAPSRQKAPAAHEPRA